MAGSLKRHTSATKYQQSIVGNFPARISEVVNCEGTSCAFRQFQYNVDRRSVLIGNEIAVGSCNQLIIHSLKDYYTEVLHLHGKVKSFHSRFSEVGPHKGVLRNVKEGYITPCFIYFLVALES